MSAPAAKAFSPAPVRIAQRWPGYAAAAQRYSALNPLRCQQQRIFDALPPINCVKEE